MPEAKPVPEERPQPGPLEKADQRLQEALRERDLVDDRPVESSDAPPQEVFGDTPHKNKSRAPLRPLDAGTLALSVAGLGFLRPAPGTWGSLPPAGLASIMVLAGAAPVWMVLALGALFVASCVACVAWGGYAEQRFGRKDAAEVVADETAGAILPMAPAVLLAGTIPVMLLQIAWAFVLFRVMDILKPWPARQLERLPRGWGVLIDDLVAGVYAVLLFNLSVLVLRMVV